MTQQERLLAARALLDACTPLTRDCGVYCGAACCQGDEKGQGGMMLFPGEIAQYTPVPDWARITLLPHIVDGEPLRMLTCRGTCPRTSRPLACRIFPLTPVLRAERLEIELDVRAWPVCPLMPHGVAGLQSAFVTAVRDAMTVLLEDPACRAYFAFLSEWLAQYQTF
ncbi:MAG: hypothetical protein RR482_08155 [Clostridia bacterium]